MSDFSSLQPGQIVFRNMPGGIKFRIPVTQVTETEIIINGFLKFDKETGKETVPMKGVSFITLS